MVHLLKGWPEYFEAVLRGRKVVEFRKEDDRHFEPGDTLVLMEWVPETDLIGPGYTGRELRARVTDICRDIQWLQPGVAALSIRPFGINALREAVT